MVSHARPRTKSLRLLTFVLATVITCCATSSYCTALLPQCDSESDAAYNYNTRPNDRQAHKAEHKFNKAKVVECACRHVAIITNMPSSCHCHDSRHSHRRHGNQVIRSSGPAATTPRKKYASQPTIRHVRPQHVRQAASTCPGTDQINTCKRFSGISNDPSNYC